MRSLTLCILLFSYVVASAQDWKQLPGPYAGSFGDLQITRNGTLFGTAASKLWKREPGSKTWKAINLDSVTNDPGRVPSLIYTDIGGSHLLTFTSYPYSNSYPQTSDGIYRSTNNGETWIQVLKNKPVLKIVTDNKGTLYALRDWKDSTTAVFRSINNGVSWDSITAFPFVGNDIAVDSNNRLYFTLLFENEVLIYDLTSGVFKSIKPTPTVDIRGNLYNYQNNILIKSKNDIYAIEGGNSIVKRSSLGTHPGPVKNIFYQTSSGELCIIARNSDTTYDYQLLVSSDTGRTWRPHLDSLPITKSQVTTYAFDSNAVNIYCGTEAGIYETSSKGKNWLGIGLPISNIQSVQRDPTGGLFARQEITYQPYFRKILSFDNGVSWRDANEIPGDGYGSFVYDSSGGIYYFLRDVKYGDQLWYANKSAPYTFELQGAPPFPPDSWRPAFVYKNSIYSHTYYSNDKGISWEYVNRPNASGLSVLSVDNHNRFYFGGTPSLYYSDNEGVSWTKLTTPLKNTTIWGVRFGDPEYIVLMNQVRDYKTNLWKSSDRGASWQLWDSTFCTTIIKYEVIGDTCYVATQYGLYSCALNSSDWKEIVLSASRAFISDMNYIDNKRLYIAVSGGGIWYKDIITTGTNAVNMNKDSSAKITVSPDKHSITAWLSHATYATIDIYDILGKQVTSLFKGMINKGSTIIPFDVSTLSPGVYFANLKTLDGIYVCKFLVDR